MYSITKPAIPLEKPIRRPVREVPMLPVEPRREPQRPPYPREPVPVGDIGYRSSTELYATRRTDDLYTR